MTNRKSYTGFTTTYRLSVYVTAKAVVLYENKIILKNIGVLF